MRALRVLLAPDKFRGSFTAPEVCAHLGRGLRDGAAPVDVTPVALADGGEGTLDVIMRVRGGRHVAVDAHGPLGEAIRARYGVTPDGVGVFEAAAFCGLDLMPPSRRDPLAATTRGLGEGIATALDAGIRRLVIGLGGSGTVDGGIGMAGALGFRFLDRDGRALAPDPAAMDRVRSIDASTAHQGLAGARITALCDVDNPALGPNGAAAAYGPQKGASPAAVAVLEARLRAFATAIASRDGSSGGSLASAKGAGAAGGLGLAAAALLGARLVPGAPAVLEMVSFERKLAACDLVVTGEGSFDRLSLAGKVTVAVIRAAAMAGRPVAVVAGRWDGTLPACGAGDLEVLTGDTLDPPRLILGGDELAAIGRVIRRRWPDIASASRR